MSFVSNHDRSYHDFMLALLSFTQPMGEAVSLHKGQSDSITGPQVYCVKSVYILGAVVGQQVGRGDIQISLKVRVIHPKAGAFR